MEHSHRTQIDRGMGARSRAAAGLSLIAAMVLGAVGWPIWRWAPAALAANLLPALACVALLLLPGLALLRLLWPGSLALEARLPLALSLSCAAPPLLLLAGSLVGVRWGGALAWLTLIVCAATALWPRRRTAASAAPPAGRQAGLALLLISGAALALRLYTTRDLVMGQFGDSVHHTIIAQLLVDNGGLFRSWEPYARLSTLTYHYGFHSMVAWLSWLSGAPTRLALLMVGQAQSALAAPLVYLLTLRLGGRRQAALWAALIVGLAGAMPAAYASWGRYTQLGGQTLLIGVCVVWQELLDLAAHPDAPPASLARLAGLAALSSAGLALTHYRVAIFAACFVIAYGIYLLAARVRSGRAVARLAIVGVAAGIATVLLALPWLLRLREGKLLQIGGSFASQNIGTDGVNVIVGSIIDLVAPWSIGALALAAILALAVRRRWQMLALPLWAALVWVAANPYLVGLTGAGIISNFAVMIAGYLVLAPLAGVALGELGDLAARLPLGRAAAPLAGVALAAWGLSWQPTLLDRSNELFRPADLQAMGWIAQETPPGARIFVNSFTAYGGTLYAGSDGGWMVTFFTGRSTNLPPITYGSEAGESPNYWAAVNRENADIVAHPVDSPATAAALRAAGFSFLYDGPAASPPGEYLNPQLIDASPLYTRVYRRDGVSIWKVR